MLYLKTEVEFFKTMRSVNIENPQLFVLDKFDSKKI